MSGVGSRGGLQVRHIGPLHASIPVSFYTDPLHENGVNCISTCRVEKVRVIRNQCAPNVAGGSLFKHRPKSRLIVVDLII